MTEFLPDVNLIFALANLEHEHAQAASKWLARQKETGCVKLCRVAQMGMLRLLTQKAAMREHALPPRAAWSALRELLRDDRFAFAEEPPGIEVEWLHLCEGLPPGASVNTDTYLAAFSLAGGLTLVTFDGGFARFPGLGVEILLP